MWKISIRRAANAVKANPHLSDRRCRVNTQPMQQMTWEHLRAISDGNAQGLCSLITQMIVDCFDLKLTYIYKALKTVTESRHLGLGRWNGWCCNWLWFLRFSHFDIKTVTFYKSLYPKSGLLHDVVWSFMIFNCDDCMRNCFHSIA